MGGDNWLDFSVGDRTWLGISVGDLTWLDFSERWNGFGCCVGCRKWLNFSLVDRLLFGFCVAVGNDLFCASGSNLTGLCVGVSELTWLQWWGRIFLGFCVSDRNWLGLRLGIELDLFVRGLIPTSVLYAGQKRLVLIYRSKLTWFFVCGPRKTTRYVFAWSSNLASTLCGWSKFTWILYADFVWVVEIHMVFVCRFCVGGRNWLGFCMLAESHLV